MKAPPRRFEASLVPQPSSELSATFRNFVHRPDAVAMPLDLEIGSGAGLFALQQSLAHPERLLISIEKTANKFSLFKQRVEHNTRRSNLLPIHGNAISWVAHEIADASLDRIYLWYPNPYPSKSRFVNTPFFGALIDKLKHGGRLYFASNVEAYALQQQQVSCEQWGLKLVTQGIITKMANHDFHPRTHFEKKYFHRGESLYELVFERP